MRRQPSLRLSGLAKRRPAMWAPPGLAGAGSGAVRRHHLLRAAFFYLTTGVFSRLEPVRSAMPEARSESPGVGSSDLGDGWGGSSTSAVGLMEVDRGLGTAGSQRFILLAVRFHRVSARGGAVVAVGLCIQDSFELGKREQSPRNVDIEMGLQGDLTSSAQPGFEGFFEKVKEVENLLSTLTKLLKDLQNSNEELKVVRKAAAMKEVKKRMEKDINEVTKVARLAKAKVEQLNKDNAANREKPGCSKGSGVDRSRMTTTVALTKRLRDRILEFQTLREEIQKEYREVVERRVYTVTGERADEETIDKLVETGDGEQIFQRAIQEQGRGRVLDTLQEIQERHDTVKEIETKLLDLQQIFLDLAVLVDAQGETLNNIESQVVGANDHIQDGTNLLQKAKKLQKSTRKWTCIAIIILLIIILVIILSIRPWEKK